ncbi:MAG: 30S ribosomal protein S21 [Oscillospiraceae bacterium]|nr:30S ribosomal protein S21 [Oscillospiraceae bacterium]
MSYSENESEVNTIAVYVKNGDLDSALEVFKKQTSKGHIVDDYNDQSSFKSDHQRRRDKQWQREVKRRRKQK